MLAGLACVALIFAGCNQAVDDVEGINNSNYAELNDGEPVTAAYAADYINNANGGTVKIVLVDAADPAEFANVLIPAITNNPQVNVELDLSKVWDDNGGEDIFGGQLRNDDATVEPGARSIIKEGLVDVDTGFAGLKNLISISLPFTVTKIDDGAFAGCENLEEVVINFFFTTNVKKDDMYATEYMFDDKYTLREVGEGAFAGCKKLAGFRLVSDPDNYEYAGMDYDWAFPVSLTNIGAGAFAGCYNLGTNSDGVISFKNTLNAGDNAGPYYEAGLRDITADPKAHTEVSNEGYNCLTVDTDGIGYNYTAGAVSKLVGANALFIGVGAFQGCTGITTVDFTNKSGVTDDSKNADVTDGDVFDLSTVPTVNLVVTESRIAESAFNGCTSLETLIFTGTNGGTTIAPWYNSVTAGEANAGKRKMWTDPAPVFTKITQYGDYCFQYTALSSETVADLLHDHDYLDEDNVADDFVTYIGVRSFFGDKALEFVELPATITVAKTMAFDPTTFTGVPTGRANVLGDGAFANTSVEYIEVHETSGFYSIHTENENQRWEGALVDEDPATDDPTTIFAWYVTPNNDGDLSWIDPNWSQNPKTKVLGEKLVDVRPDAFYNNTGVKKILFPAVTSDGNPPSATSTYTTLEIGSYAFANCTSLESVEYYGSAANDIVTTPTKNGVWSTDVEQGIGAFVNTPEVSDVLCVLDSTSASLRK